MWKSLAALTSHSVKSAIMPQALPVVARVMMGVDVKTW
jgi:hypothetical protein